MFPDAEEMADEGGAEMGAPKEGLAVQGITSSAWRALAEISGRTADELYDPICFIDNVETDTQVGGGGAPSEVFSGTGFRIKG
jgi:hypothetical protein